MSKYRYSPRPKEVKATYLPALNKWKVELPGADAWGRWFVIPDRTFRILFQPNCIGAKNEIHPREPGTRQGATERGMAGQASSNSPKDPAIQEDKSLGFDYHPLPCVWPYYEGGSQTTQLDVQRRAEKNQPTMPSSQC